MNLLGITIYNGSASAALLEKKGGKLSVLDIQADTSLSSLLAKNDKLKKNGVKKAVISFSDEYVNYFLHDMKNAPVKDTEKIIAFKAKEFVPFPPAEMNIGWQTEPSADTTGLTSVSAIININLVAEHEALLMSRGFSDITSFPASFPFLNLCEGTDYAAACGFGGIVTVYFVSGGRIVYIRKLPASANNELDRTINFYLNKYKGSVVKELYIFGEVDTDGIKIPIKEHKFTEMLSNGGDVDVTKLKLAGPSIGALSCV